MADLWEKVKRTATEFYTTASEKAVDGVSLGVLKLDEANLRRELSREFTELGGRTYQLIQGGESAALESDPTVAHRLRRLRDLERRLEEKEREIEALRSKGEDPDESSSDPPALSEPEPEKATSAPDGESAS